MYFGQTGVSGIQGVNFHLAALREYSFIMTVSLQKTDVVSHHVCVPSTLILNLCGLDVSVPSSLLLITH